MKNFSERLQLVLLIGAAVGVMGGGAATVVAIGESKVHNLVAQEMKSRDYQMEYMMNETRKQDDERQVAVCNESKSNARCALESEHRWNTWRWIDCTQAGETLQVCGPKPELNL